MLLRAPFCAPSGLGNRRPAERIRRAPRLPTLLSVTPTRFRHGGAHGGLPTAAVGAPFRHGAASRRYRLGSGNSGLTALLRQAEPPHTVAPAASPWPINAALRGRGAEGAVRAELGRGLARLPTANAGAVADESSFFS